MGTIVFSRNVLNADVYCLLLRKGIILTLQHCSRRKGAKVKFGGWPNSVTGFGAEKS